MGRGRGGGVEGGGGRAKGRGTQRQCTLFWVRAPFRAPGQRHPPHRGWTAGGAASPACRPGPGEQGGGTDAPDASKTRNGARENEWGACRVVPFSPGRAAACRGRPCTPPMHTHTQATLLVTRRKRDRSPEQQHRRAGGERVPPLHFCPRALAPIGALPLLSPPRSLSLTVLQHFQQGQRGDVDLLAGVHLGRVPAGAAAAAQAAQEAVHGSSTRSIENREKRKGKERAPGSLSLSRLGEGRGAREVWERRGRVRSRRYERVWVRWSAGRVRVESQAGRRCLLVCWCACAGESDARPPRPPTLSPPGPPILFFFFRLRQYSHSAPPTHP